MKKKIMIIFGVLMLSSFSIAYANDSIKAVLYPVSYDINNKKQEIQEGYVTLKYNNRVCSNKIYCRKFRGKGRS